MSVRNQGLTSMRGKLLCLLLLSLVGCSSPEAYQSIDVPHFPANPVNVKRVQVVVKVEWLSRESLKRLVSDSFTLSGQYKLIKGKVQDQASSGYLGMAKLPTDREPTCTIYALKPEAANSHAEIYTLGHEFLHCLAGHYH